ncbi:MAG TPA: adenosylcobinamide-phosphate synthase CbiB [Nitrospira sp.]|nr:adenosylcobinamide-phosphate synthase CbiB [Nitrospira sp.]
MTPIEFLAACLVDAVIGDPPAWPHPVRWMGRLIALAEKWVRRFCVGSGSLRLTGVALALGLPSLTFCAGWAVMATGAAVHDWIGRGIGIWLASTVLAWRDLIDHVRAVSRALKAGTLDEARHAVGLIVGRDTDRLSEQEIVRATVETIAESASDGIIAPVFFLVVGGPPLALAYKAVSTLDSMIGHRDAAYRDFGWASAKLDDVVNWIPARLTGWLIALAAGAVCWNTRSVHRSGAVLLRDGHKHPSPNSGRPEAAMAGALGIQLGGTNCYAGLRHDRPLLGDALAPLLAAHIDRAQQIMTVAYLIAIAACLGFLWE